MLDYILQHSEVPKNAVFINTIVTTQLQEKIAEKHGVTTYKTYTGFKHIAEAMARIERDNHAYIFSCEESYGYLPSMDVRDKDGISIALLCIEMAKSYYTQGKNNDRSLA